MGWVKRNGPSAVAIIGHVAWFGGLVRVLGEVAAAFQSAILPHGLDGLAWFSLGVTAVILLIFFKVSFPWYQRFYRQHRSDLAVTYGVPVGSLPSFWPSLRQQARPLATIGVAVLVVALLLPGIAAAAVAIVIGLLLRLTATVLKSSRDIRRP
jgi:hypothetical protein